MNKKKLIIISYDFPPQDGGIARLCQEIAVGQKEYFNKVTVLTTNRTGVSFTYNFSEIDKIEFSEKRIKCEKEIFTYLKKIVNKDDYVVLAATWHPEGLLGYITGFKNLFILAHGTELLSGNSFFRNQIWIPIYSKFLLKKANVILCNSTYTANLVNKIQPKANMISLPLGVNEDFFKPIKLIKENEKFIISTVSRIEKFKGHDFIAKVIARLPQEVKDNIHWNIAGTGPDLQYLKQTVKDLLIENLVTFLGFVDDKDLPVFYNKSDVFVLCSRESKKNITVEGFGLVFLEAQSCGIPTIGTLTGGIQDAIEQENGGFLIDQDNEAQLREILLKLFYDNDYLEAQKHLARARVLKGCTWKQYNKKLNNILIN